jgi:hypothetical protein
MSEACMRYPGWRVVIACFAMTFFGFGFGFYGHSVYLAALTGDQTNVIKTLPFDQVDDIRDMGDEIDILAQQMWGRRSPFYLSAIFEVEDSAGGENRESA